MTDMYSNNEWVVLVQDNYLRAIRNNNKYYFGEFTDNKLKKLVKKLDDIPKLCFTFSSNTEIKNTMLSWMNQDQCSSVPDWFVADLMIERLQE